MKIVVVISRTSYSVKCFSDLAFCFMFETVSPKKGDGLSRSKSERLPALDGLRGVGVILVFICHATDGPSASPQLHLITPYFPGGLGVWTFFVISGFIITWLLAREKSNTGDISLKLFYIRRFLRIFPVEAAYIVCLFILTRISRLHIPECAFITSITYTKNYACAVRPDGHFWSLSVEEQFYIFWPVAYLAFTRRRATLVAITLIVLAPVSRAIQYHNGTHLIWWLSSNADALMIGCLMAMEFESPWLRRFITIWPSIGRLSAVILIALPFIMLNYHFLGIFTIPFGPLLQAVCIAYLIASFLIIQKGLLYEIFNNKIVGFIGLASYSLYVWQQIFFYTSAADYGVADSVLFHFPMNVVLACGVGMLSYWCIERTTLRLRGMFIKTKQGVSSKRLGILNVDSPRGRDAASVGAQNSVVPSPKIDLHI